MSPLEKRLQDLGPIRGDGSDKFFGMENVRYIFPLTCLFSIIASEVKGLPKTDLNGAHALVHCSTEIHVIAIPYYNASTIPFLSAKPS